MNSLEHGNSPEGFRTVLQSMLHILNNSLLPYGFLDPSLRFHVERVRIERLDLALASQICLVRSRDGLPQELSKTGGVRLRGSSKFRLRLWREW